MLLQTNQTLKNLTYKKDNKKRIREADDIGMILRMMEVHGAYDKVLYNTFNLNAHSLVRNDWKRK